MHGQKRLDERPRRRMTCKSFPFVFRRAQQKINIGSEVLRCHQMLACWPAAERRIRRAFSSGACEHTPCYARKIYIVLCGPCGVQKTTFLHDKQFCGCRNSFPIDVQSRHLRHSSAPFPISSVLKGKRQLYCNVLTVRFTQYPLPHWLRQARWGPAIIYKRTAAASSHTFAA